MTWVEQHRDGDRVVHADLDLAHVTDLVMIGDRGGRALVGLEHLDLDSRGIRQQRAAPAARAKWAHRGQREQPPVDRNDRPLGREVIGGGSRRRRDHDAVGRQFGEALLAVDQDPQVRGLMALAEYRHLIYGARLVALARRIDRAHEQWVDQGCPGFGEALRQSFLAKLVHQEADRSPVHPVDRLAGRHEPVQGLQHQAVAAERNDHVGFLGRRVAVMPGQAGARVLGFGHRACDKGDPRMAGIGHGSGSRRYRAHPAAGRMLMNAERAVFVYTTYPSLVEAERIGKAVLERRLAACVNILPGMISHYWWQGAIERGEEVVMIIKTRASLAEGVRGAVKQMHSYTTPAILVLPIEGGEAGYLDWLMKETEGAA